MKKTAIFMMLSVAAAVVPIYAARPLATDDAGTVEKGKSEAELSFDYCQYRPEGTGQTPGISVKHGLTDNLDLGLGFSHGTDKDDDGKTVSWGMSPLEIGFKMALLKEHQMLPDISLSTGFESGSAGYSINLILSRTIKNIILHYNFGYNSSGEAMVKGSLPTSLAAEWQFLGKYRLCGELCSEISDDRSAVIENSGLVGGSADLGFAVWDLGLRLFDERGPQSSVTSGFTIGF